MWSMPETDALLTDLFEGLSLTRAVVSKPRSRELPAKVTVDPVELRGETAFRFTIDRGGNVAGTSHLPVSLVWPTTNRASA